MLPHKDFILFIQLIEPMGALICNTRTIAVQVWGQVRTLMEKNASLEATKRSLEEEIERVLIDFLCLSLIYL